MSRNVTIVVVILVLVVMAGYLIWIRSRYQPPISPSAEREVTQTEQPTPSASPTATPAVQEATGSMRQRSATSSPQVR